LKLEPEAFADREVILVYIARRLDDALRLEAALTAAGFDYVVEADQYTGGVVFRTVRTGAFFYVLPENAAAARDVIAKQGMKPLVE